MPGKYELTPRAERDLKDIWLYTAETWGDDQAEAYIAALEKQFEALTASPFMGPARPDVCKECRYLPEGKHLIFYRVDGDTVVILAVLHASMDIARHVKPEDV